MSVFSMYCFLQLAASNSPNLISAYRYIRGFLYDACGLTQDVSTVVRVVLFLRESCCWPICTESQGHGGGGSQDDYGAEE